MLEQSQVESEVQATKGSLYCHAVIMADDSGSMKLAENGERIKDLEAMLSRIAGSSMLCGPV